MGASSWNYFVPYQPDLNAALQELRSKVFAEGRYHWIHGDEALPADQRLAKPASMGALFDDPDVQECGTHSILDMYRVILPDETPDFGRVSPVTTEEAVRRTGTDRLTRAHVGALEELASQRWFGRCAVLRADNGEPEEIYFWGYSGD
jgi:hypothetical protein